MFGLTKYSLRKEKRENEIKLRKLHEREVKYASTRDNVTYGETVIGKNGIIKIVDDNFAIICKDKVIFESPIKYLWGSDLMSLDGIILTRVDKELDSYDEIESDDKIVVYYKYYRKVD
jgi:hypothetical protein